MKRRKPVAIVEPPKYQYPTFENDVQKKEPDNKNTTGDLNCGNKKPMQNLLAVVTKTKIPDEILDKIIPIESASKQNEQQTNNKPMITHAKPNYTLPRKNNVQIDKINPTNGVNHNNNNNNNNVNKTASANGTNIENNNNENNVNKVYVRDEHKFRPATIDGLAKPDEIVKSAAGPIKITINNSSAPAPPPLPIKTIAGKSVTTTLINSCQSCNNDVGHSNGKKKLPSDPSANASNYSNQKLFLSHGKPNFVVKSCDKQTPTTPKDTLNSKQQCENYLEVKIKSLKPQKSRDDSLTDNNIIFNQQINTLKHPNDEANNNPLKNIIKSLKPHKTVDEIDASSNLNQKIYTGNGTLPRKLVSTWQEQNKINNNHKNAGHLPLVIKDNHSKIFSETSNNIHSFNKNGVAVNGVTNFQQKTMVSFSKDLQDAPNLYPEMVKVTKTITTKSETTTVHQQNMFSNIKFIIGNDGQVMHK